MAQAAVLPSGFIETRLAGPMMTNATTMAIAPDGRVFVSEQGVVNAATPGKGPGSIRIFKNDALLPTPALTLTVDPTNERGMLGIAFDPAFATNQYIYVYWTVPQATFDPSLPNLGAHNRISRFTMSGDTVVAGSEFVLLDLPLLGTAPIHNSGSLHFGQDGKLYVSVGENFNGANSQNLAVPLGKLLRINTDGSAPADNPFVSTPGANPLIWAYGLRNPFTFDIQPGTGRIFVNDVGDKLFDEINDIVKGGNYGWSETEGPHTNPNFLQPFYYRPWSSADCTLIGAAFYDPPVRNFPASYVGTYFYSDLCAGYIKMLNPTTGASTTFVASGLKSPVDLDVSPDGKLYYLNRGAGVNTGEVFRIEVGDGSPHISVPPTSQLVTNGDTVTFTCSANGFAPLSFEWLRNGATVSGPAPGVGDSSSYSFVVSPGDDGSTYQCKATNDFGSDTSAAATLNTTSNQAPTAFILTPAEGSTYRGGETIFFSGDATDPEGLPIPDSLFKWTVVFDHDTHSHPGIVLTGVRSGSYPVPQVGEQATTVKYRIILDVTDPGAPGLVRHLERNVLPRLTTITVTSNPVGRDVKLDGQPKVAPVTTSAVSGMTRTIETSVMQHESEGAPTAAASTVWYEFLNWSDGGARAHTITVPDSPTTYTANFNRVDGPECITFDTLSRFLNSPFPNQTGQFSVEFDATPVSSTATVINVNIGLSDGPRGGLPGQAAMVIFNNAGRIQGRGFTGGQVDAGVTNNTYVIGSTYHARMEIDINTHTYDVYITPPGGPEYKLATALRFRVEHQFITQLNNWGVFASVVPGDPSATVRVCRFSVNCSNSKNTGPVVTAPSDVVVTTGPSGCDRQVTDVQLGTATVTDNCKFGLSGITRAGVPAGNVFPKGVTFVTYSATDGAGVTTTATQKVTVVDDTPPTLTVPADVVVSMGASATACSRVVTNAELGTATATDNCTSLGAVTRSGVPAGNVFPKGDTFITYTVSDGTNTTSRTQKVTVLDNAAPKITGLSATPNVLWPPNHKMVTVAVNYTTSDNCGPVSTVVSVTSDQPAGIFTPDFVVVNAHTVQLRAERSIIPALFGKGRTYTIKVTAVDGSGNSTVQTVTVKVPAWMHTHKTGCKNSEHQFDKDGD